MMEVAMLGKLACAIAVALPLMAGTVEAKAVCGANTGVCIAQDGNTHFFGFRFRGDAITHFNVRYTRMDGRTIQKQVDTGDSNTASTSLADIEKGNTTIHVQACSRN